MKDQESAINLYDVRFYAETGLGWSDWLEEHVIETHGQKLEIRGTVQDSASLFGFLKRLRNTGGDLLYICKKGEMK